MHMLQGDFTDDAIDLVSPKLSQLGIEDESGQITLSKLERLRWLAVIGQSATVLIASFAGIDLPIRLLLTLIGLTALSNFSLRYFRTLQTRWPQALLAGIIGVDTVLLTIMLYWTGGAHNPFTSFYLLHLAIGAVTLDALLAWLTTGLCTVCFAILFASPHPLSMPHHHSSQMTMSLHLQGMLVAFILSGCCISYFITRLRRELHRREAELAQSRTRAARTARLASLATLAAGVAHELATPLGTIAVISKDLEHAAMQMRGSNDLTEDAKLIRSEVQRCRDILGKLNRDSTGGLGDAPEAVRISAILEQLRDRVWVGQGNQLDIDNQVGDLVLFVPKEPIIQALVTLTNNALEASRPGTAVRMLITHLETDIRFEIRDQGPGMSSQIMAHIGEPFFTTKEPGRGMGLGLFLVRTLAEELGGALEVSSVPGAGSTFALTLTQEMRRPSTF